MHQKNNPEALVSAVVPALNEERTIAGIVSVLSQHPRIGEVLVIDDGSRDSTGARAMEAGAVVITLPHNMGKGSALGIGVGKARHDVVLFLDADLHGLSEKMISVLVDPVLRGECAVAVGLHDRRYYWLNAAHRIVPILAGQRALRKRIWYHIPAKYRKNFQTEIALNYFARKNKESIQYILLRGLSHTVKERKHGLFSGLKERLLMSRDLIAVIVSLYGAEALALLVSSVRSLAVEEARD